MIVVVYFGILILMNDTSVVKSYDDMLLANIVDSTFQTKKILHKHLSQRLCLELRP